MLKYLKNSEVDKTKWDECVKKSKNSLIYAYSWYLDIVSPQWDALVLNNYEAVMPLTWKKKIIYYLTQPFFTQQLGIFSAFDINVSLSKNFIEAIPKKYKLIDINLNETNKEFVCKDVDFIKRNNFLIDLSENYESIYENYNRNCKRNIKKAEEAGLKITTDINITEHINFLIANIGNQLKKIKRKDYLMLAKIIASSISKNSGELLAIKDKDNNLIASASFLNTPSRIIFHTCSSNSEAKKYNAMYLMVDNMIKRFAGSGKIFDFSGSNNPGIAYFNSTFGAKLNHYYEIRINRLPSILKYFV